MICPICGNKTADGSKACPNCGTAFKYVYDTPAPVVKKKMDIKILILCIVALVILAVVVFVVGMKIGDANTDTKINFITQHNPDEEQSEKEPDGDSDDSGITITINGGTGVAAGGAAGGAASNQSDMSNAEEKELVQSSSGLEMPQDGDAINITKAYNKAVNDLKAYTGKVTLTKTETVDIDNKEVPEEIEGVVNAIISMYEGTTTDTSVYNNGADEYGEYLDEVILPSGREACVTPSDIASCKITENADGGYTIEMTFLAESVTFDGTTGIEPVHHKTAMDPLDLGTLDTSPLKIASAEMNYPGAMVKLTVDGEGRLVELNNNLPLNGKCQGGLDPIKATVGFESSIYSTYSVVYG